MKTLDEMDLLKIKSVELEIENMMMTIELAQNRAHNANEKIESMRSLRDNIIATIKKKYSIADNFRYDRETGHITEIKPAS